MTDHELALLAAKREGARKMWEFAGSRSSARDDEAFTEALVDQLYPLPPAPPRTVTYHGDEFGFVGAVLHKREDRETPWQIVTVGTMSRKFLAALAPLLEGQ